MEFLKFEIEPSDIPTPDDYDTEVETARRLLDLCEFPQFNPLESSLRVYGKMTPWIAWQLGCAAEAVAERRDYEKAFRIAATSVKAAIEAQAVARLYANLLTLSGILLRSGNIEEAESQFLNILELPFPGGEKERASAHVSLGGIYEHKGMIRDALYHYERGLSYLRNTVPQQIYRRILEELSHLYAVVEDAAGLAYCCTQLGLGDAEGILRQSINGEMHVEELLFLTTRLHSLGEHKLADFTTGHFFKRLTHGIL